MFAQLLWGYQQLITVAYRRSSKETKIQLELKKTKSYKAFSLYFNVFRERNYLIKSNYVIPPPTLSWPFDYILFEKQKDPSISTQSEYHHFLAYLSLQKCDFQQAERHFKISVLHNPAQDQFVTTLWWFMGTCLGKEVPDTVQQSQVIDVGAGECNGHYLSMIMKEVRECESQDHAKAVAKAVIYLTDEMEMWVQFCCVNWQKRIEGTVEWRKTFLYYSTILFNRSIDQKKAQQLVQIKAIKLVLEMIVYYKNKLKDKTLSASFIEDFTKDLNQALDKVCNSAAYQRNKDKLSKYLAILNYFYDFETDSKSLEKLLELLPRMSQKLTFAFQLMSKILSKEPMNKKIYEIVQKLNKEIKEEIMKLEQDYTEKTVRQLTQLDNCNRYIDIYCYQFSVEKVWEIKSGYTMNQEFEISQLLSIMKETAENCFKNSNENTNLMFVYLHYCYYMEKFDELEQLLKMFISMHISKNQELLWNYFYLLLNYSNFLNKNSQDSKNQALETIKYLKDNFKLNNSTLSILYYLEGVLILQSQKENTHLPYHYIKLAALYAPQYSNRLVQNIIMVQDQEKNMIMEEQCEMIQEKDEDKFDQEKFMEEQLDQFIQQEIEAEQLMKK